VTSQHPDKVYENRMRRVAGRQGLTLRKTRRLDPLALDYKQYTLTNASGQTRTFDSLEAAEQYLITPRAERDGNEEGT